MGVVEVDAAALWGAQTQRAVGHFEFGDERMPKEVLHALACVKGACAVVNGRLGRLDGLLAAAIDEAAAEVVAGQHDAEFPLAVWQSGSGTQSNMNVNEVLAHLAQKRLGDSHRVHPNDDVNRGQSSNDVFPTAMHVASVAVLRSSLLPALDALMATLAAKAQAYEGLIKLGRTHLQDAVPLTVGQEIGAWRSQLGSARAAIVATEPALLALAIGGTAVGTGLNTTADFGELVCRELTARSSIPFTAADNRFAALAGHEALLALHGALKVLAVALMKMANDVRLLASGPRAGFGELLLPENEPGSSIMPGKVNPTQCESMAMVACQVIGNDGAITAGAGGGHLQLNTFKPLIIANVLRSLRLLSASMRSFDVHCAQGLSADAVRIGELVDRSLMLVTALAPHIGYDRAAHIAHRAHAERTSLREAALAMGVAATDFDRWVRPQDMLGPK